MSPYKTSDLVARGLRHENINQSWAKHSGSFSTPYIENMSNGISTAECEITEKKSKCGSFWRL